MESEHLSTVNNDSDNTNLNNDRKIKYLTKCARNGDIQCMIELGDYYKKINNYEKMILYYNGAKDRGDVNSMFQLGQYYEEIMDLTKMVYYYKLASTNGNTIALEKLYEHFLKNNNYEELNECAYIAKKIKYPKTLFLIGKYFKQIELISGKVLICCDSTKYFKMAAELNHKESILELTKIYDEERKYELKEGLLVQAVKNGNIKAMHDLGQYYEEQGRYKEMWHYYKMGAKNGSEATLDRIYQFCIKFGKRDGLDEYVKIAESIGYAKFIFLIAQLFHPVLDNNWGIAKKYYLMSAKLNHEQSILYIAKIYEIENNDIEQIKWLKKGVENGFISCMFELGSYYLDKDINLSKMYYTMIPEDQINDEQSILNLSKIYEEEKNDIEQRRWLEKGIEISSLECMFELGNYYLDKDINIAKSYYIMSANLNYEESIFNLARIYNEEKNDDEQKRWLEKGVEIESIHCMIELVEYYFNRDDENNMLKYALMAIEKDKYQIYEQESFKDLIFPLLNRKVNNLGNAFELTYHTPIQKYQLSQGIYTIEIHDILMIEDVDWSYVTNNHLIFFTKNNNKYKGTLYDKNYILGDLNDNIFYDCMRNNEGNYILGPFGGKIPNYDNIGEPYIQIGLIDRTIYLQLSKLLYVLALDINVVVVDEVIKTLDYTVSRQNLTDDPHYMSSQHCQSGLPRKIHNLFSAEVLINQ